MYLVVLRHQGVVGPGGHEDMSAIKRHGAGVHIEAQQDLCGAAVQPGDDLHVLVRVLAHKGHRVLGAEAHHRMWNLTQESKGERQKV
jgi:hypothetical protein